MTQETANEKPSLLEQIGRSMKYIATTEPMVRRMRKLSGGAQLAIYATNDGEFHLLISRPLVPPSPTEVSVFRHAFGVPHDVLSERCCSADSKLQGVRIVWREPGQGSLPDAAAGQNALPDEAATPSTSTVRAQSAKARPEQTYEPGTAQYADRFSILRLPDGRFGVYAVSSNSKTNELLEAFIFRRDAVNYINNICVPQLKDEK